MIWHIRGRCGFVGPLVVPMIERPAVKAAFAMGADYVGIGTIAQPCRESGTCDAVRSDGRRCREISGSELLEK